MRGTTLIGWVLGGKEDLGWGEINKRGANAPLSIDYWLSVRPDVDISCRISAVVI